MNIKTTFSAAVLAAALLFTGVAMAGDAEFPLDSDVVTTGEIVVGGSTPGHIIGTTTPSISGSLTIGSSGTAITQMRIVSTALSPSQVAAQSCAEQSFSVSGVTSADALFVNQAFETDVSAALTTARASSTSGTALLTFCNVSSAAATPDDGTFTFLAIRS